MSFFVIHPYEPTSLRRILQSKTAQRARRVKPTTRRVVGSQSERGQCPKPDRWFESNWGSHKKKGTERMSFFFVIHPYEPTSLRRILQSKTAQRARRVKPTTRSVVGSQSERGQCPKPDRWFESNRGSHDLFIGREKNFAPYFDAFWADIVILLFRSLQTNK